MNLYRISTKRADVWSNKTPKAVYVVVKNKAEALAWATKNLSAGLAVSKITYLAEQVAGSIFIAGKE